MCSSLSFMSRSSSTWKKWLTTCASMRLMPGIGQVSQPRVSEQYSYSSDCRWRCLSRVGSFCAQFMLTVLSWHDAGSWAIARCFVSSTPGLSLYQPDGFISSTLRHLVVILVGVAMDTVAQIEAQLVMRNYQGFSGRAAVAWTARPSYFRLPIAIANCD